MKLLVVRNGRIFYLLIAVMVIVTACVPGTAEPAQDTPTPADDEDVGLANPASVYCEEQGGRLEIRSDDAGNQYGVCVFEDDSECEEWAYLRGECQPGETNESSADDEANLVETLDSTDWDLVEMAGNAPLPDSTITISFSGEEFGGSAGCNSYFGSYASSGSQMSVGMMGNTEMWCEGLMEQEQAYLSMLGAAESVDLEEGRLIVHTGEGDLVYQMPKDGTLEGVTWILSGIAQDEAVVQTWIDAEITTEFSEGQVGGSAGCNQYFASYEVDDKSLALGPIGSTKKLCDEERNEREAAFLSALAAVKGYEIKRERLALIDGEGTELLIFQAQSEADDMTAELLDKVWQWQAYEDSAEINDVLVDDPSRYTLEFLADGTYLLRADCNQGSGGYAIDGSSLTLGPGPMTMAACGPDSLDGEFLSRLNDVVTYVLAEGKLFLNLKMDAGNMIFVPAE